MIFRIVQYLMWLIRTLWFYFTLDQCCHFQARTWRLTICLILNAGFSLNIWTVNSMPLWICWISQVGVDLILITDCKPDRFFRSRFLVTLIWIIELESCWILGWVLFSPLTAEFSVPEGKILIVILGMLLSMAVGAALFYVISIARMRNASSKTGLILIFTSLLNVFVAHLFAQNPSTENWILCFLIGLSSGLLGNVLQRAEEKQILDLQQKTLEETAAALTKSQQKVENTSQALHELRHSVKDHFLILQQLNRNGETEEIDQYLLNLTKQTASEHFGAFCMDPVINAILNRFQESRKDIHFDIIVEPNLVKIPYEAYEIVSLALNNACEELDRNQNLSKIIGINIVEIGINIVININNSLSYIKSLQTEKKDGDHGIGLKRMRKLAESIDSNLDIHQTDYFILQLKIPKDRCKISS